MNRENKTEAAGGKRALKNVSIQQLETAIAAALSKITAEKYEVEIRHFSLALEQGTALRDGAVIELRAIAADAVADGTPDPLARAKAACCLVDGTVAASAANEVVQVPAA